MQVHFAVILAAHFAGYVIAMIKFPSIIETGPFVHAYGALFWCFTVLIVTLMIVVARLNWKLRHRPTEASKDDELSREGSGGCLSGLFDFIKSYFAERSIDDKLVE